MEQLKQVVAYIFKGKGKEIMSEQEFVFSVSMDLHWFSPEDCKKLLSTCIQADILVKEPSGLRPNFDFKNFPLPIDFKPSRDILEYKRDLFLEILTVIEKNTKLERRAIIAEINKLQNGLNIEVEVAALLLAKKNNIDVLRYISDVERAVSKRR